MQSLMQPDVGLPQFPGIYHWLASAYNCLIETLPAGAASCILSRIVDELQYWLANEIAAEFYSKRSSEPPVPFSMSQRIESAYRG